MMSKQRQFAAVAMMLSFAIGVSSASAVRADRSATNSYGGSTHSDKHTTQYKPKEGFEKRPTDIVNTLKYSELGKFTILDDGLTQAFSLDNVLRGKGPLTLFAPTNGAFEHIPQEDRDSLWANKKKLAQVLKYHVVEGKLTADDLKDGVKLKTMEGHEISVTRKGDDIYLDKALVKITNIPAVNGEVFVLEDVIMPPLAK